MRELKSKLKLISKFSSYVFLLTAAVLTISNLAFCLMCSAEPAHWTTDEFSRNASRSKIHTIEESIDQNGQSKWNNN